MTAKHTIWTATLAMTAAISLSAVSVSDAACKPNQCGGTVTSTKQVQQQIAKNAKPGVYNPGNYGVGQKKSNTLGMNVVNCPGRSCNAPQKK